jgi:hypothetical protein
MTDYQLATLRDIRAKTKLLDHHTDELGLFIAWALSAAQFDFSYDHQN